MQKQAPSLPRIAAMVLFALSCVGLLMYLWLSFGGAIPLKPQGYRVQVAFPEAAMLGEQVDVRISGVTVGKVVGKEVDPGTNRSVATLQLDSRYAPIPSDTRAMLRRKTVVGETYVELTQGSKDAEPVPDGGRLPDRAVRETVELDEIFDTFDPYTRAAYRTWQRQLGNAARRRGRDLNDALGNLPGFVEYGGDLMEVLRANRRELRGVVRDAGAVFGALTQQERQLRKLVEAQDDVFSAIASEREAWADTWLIFPTFLDESRATMSRLERFATDTRPLIRDMRPALRNLRLALPDLAALGPDLERYFVRQGPIIDVSRRSLPATQEVLRGTQGLLDAVGPFLEQLNPVLDFLGVQAWTLADMFANLGVATAARTPQTAPDAVGHYLRQFGVSGLETAAMWPTRLASNRGNAYLGPLAGLYQPRSAEHKILPNFDCDHVGGERKPVPGPPATLGCYEQQPLEFQGLSKRYPNVQPNRYDR